MIEPAQRRPHVSNFVDFQTGLGPARDTLHNLPYLTRDLRYLSFPLLHKFDAKWLSYPEFKISIHNTLNLARRVPPFFTPYPITSQRLVCLVLKRVQSSRYKVLEKLPVPLKPASIARSVYYISSRSLQSFAVTRITQILVTQLLSTRLTHLRT